MPLGINGPTIANVFELDGECLTQCVGHAAAAAAMYV